MRGSRLMACDVRCVSFTRRTGLRIELDSFQGVLHQSAELKCEPDSIPGQSPATIFRR